MINLFPYEGKEYISRPQASQALKISINTLKSWEYKGLIGGRLIPGAGNVTWYVYDDLLNLIKSPNKSKRKKEQN